MTKVKTKENNFSILQILGSLFLIFAVADFALSWMGVNLTPFMGSASRFSPIIFGVIGTALICGEARGIGRPSRRNGLVPQVIFLFACRQ